MRIPLSAPDVTEQDILAVAEVLRTPRLSLGPKLEEFESAMAEYIGVAHGIGVSSGTSGLHLCIRALGIGEGDEVIVPSFAFIAPANAVRYERATPIFVDIHARTLNLDPARIEAAITPRTKAIIVVHTFGLPADMGKILSIARKHRLFVIEDACEALGAEYEGKKAGGLGDAGVFGFYPNKQITTGEGGMVVTQREEIATAVKVLRNQGREDSKDWFQHTELGYNYRISEISCALGIAQLKRIEEILKRRTQVAALYGEKLREVPELALPNVGDANYKISWFVYVVRLGEQFSGIERDQIMLQMNSRGIAAGRYFAPIHMQPLYKTTSAGRAQLPVTEAVAPRCLALPFFNRIREEEVEEVCNTLRELVREVRRQRGA